MEKSNYDEKNRAEVDSFLVMFLFELQELAHTPSVFPVFRKSLIGLDVTG